MVDVRKNHSLTFANYVAFFLAGGGGGGGDLLQCI